MPENALDQLYHELHSADMGYIRIWRERGKIFMIYPNNSVFDESLDAIFNSHASQFDMVSVSHSSVEVLREYGIVPDDFTADELRKLKDGCEVVRFELISQASASVRRGRS